MDPLPFAPYVHTGASSVGGDDVPDFDLPMHMNIDHLGPPQVDKPEWLGGVGIVDNRPARRLEVLIQWHCFGLIPFAVAMSAVEGRED